jgi:hypothetical protein
LQFDAFMTVGGGVAGGVGVLGVEVVLDDVVLGAGDVVLGAGDVVLGAGDVLDPVVVVDAELVCEPRVPPQAVRIAIAVTRMMGRAAIDTRRRAVRRGLCDGRVTDRRISASAAPVIRRGEASSIPQTTYMG